MKQCSPIFKRKQSHVSRFFLNKKYELLLRSFVCCAANILPDIQMLILYRMITTTGGGAVRNTLKNFWQLYAHWVSAFVYSEWLKSGSGHHSWEEKKTPPKKASTPHWQVPPCREGQKDTVSLECKYAFYYPIYYFFCV